MTANRNTASRQRARTPAAKAAPQETSSPDTVDQSLLTPEREVVREPVADLPPGAVMGRNGEVLTRKRVAMDDRFYVPEELKEPGWSYEWKTDSIFGEQQISHQVALLENGWRPVMAEGRWRGRYMPNDYKGPVVRDGLVLMERPMSLTQEAYEEERRAAVGQIRSTAESLRLAMPSGFAEKKPDIKQSYEKGPPQAKHQLVSD